ncbi:MAG: hypothetical protein LH472_13815 [Pyrinomonadaceae bacterium]|nr:hypothetical protein [Pyrinomonadaceae bacterium]
MQLKKRAFTKLSVFCFVGTLGLFASSEVKAQANLQKAIAAHINKVRGDAVEYKEARKIVDGDVDGDGKPDAVVQYTLEGFGGGNSWGQSLAVFLNKKGVYKMSANKTVGGKFFRSFDVLKVENKEIIGATETCPKDEPQGLCENPAKKKVKFVLVGGKLKEK